jgi:hypothetical protein
MGVFAGKVTATIRFERSSIIGRTNFRELPKVYLGRYREVRPGNAIVERSGRVARTTGRVCLN